MFRGVFLFHVSVTSIFFFQGMDTNIFKEAFESPKVDFILSHAIYCRDVLKLKKGQRAVISNGRVRSDGERDPTCGKDAGLEQQGSDTHSDLGMGCGPPSGRWLASQLFVQMCSDLFLVL